MAATREKIRTGTAGGATAEHALTSLDAYFRTACILVVISEDTARQGFRSLLDQATFGEIISTGDVRDLQPLCIWREPDLIITDLAGGTLSNAIATNTLVREMFWSEAVPTLVVLTSDTPAGELEALTAGARGVLSYPVNPVDALAHVRSQLEVRFLFRDMRARERQLEADIREHRAALQRERVDALDRLRKAAEYRDDDTGAHSRRVGNLSAKIADLLDQDPAFIECIWRAASLHDIGKVATPDAILLKPGKLSAEEMATMKMHTDIGGDILSGAQSDYIRMAEIIARTHHDWWDGSGERGLVGDEIPIEGRIVAVADVLDALTSARPYRPAWAPERALAHVLGLAGTQFDPAVTDALVKIATRDGLTSL